MPDFCVIVIDHHRFKKGINGAAQNGQSIELLLIIQACIFGHDGLMEGLLLRRGEQFLIHRVVIMFGLRANTIGPHIGGFQIGPVFAVEKSFQLRRMRRQFDQAHAGDAWASNHELLKLGPKQQPRKLEPKWR